MKRILFVLGFVCLTSVWPAFGCKLAPNSYHEFPEAEYVFIGKVTGYAEGTKAAAKQTSPTDKTAFGLKVEPTGILNAPTTPTKYFEVFPLKVAANCSRTGAQLQSLEQDYPVGTEVRVVMRDATTYTEKVPPGVVRVEQIAVVGGSLIKNGDNEGRFKTTIDSLFDYKALNYNPNGDDAYQQRCLVEFELRKDLYRLELTKTRAERQAILKRLVFAPNGTDFDLKLIRFYYKN